MDMTYDSMDKDGSVKTLPLFADIDIRTPRYTFSHPSGLLYATQFAQIALVVTEKAAFEDMRSKGLVQKDCAFAGHSLGEYSALASIANVLPISKDKEKSEKDKAGAEATVNFSSFFLIISYVLFFASSPSTQTIGTSTISSNLLYSNCLIFLKAAP